VRASAAEPAWDLTRLNAAFEAGRVAFWDWDIASGDVRWGGYQFGVFEPDLTSSVREDAAFLQLIHPDDRELLARRISPCRDRGEPFKAEFRVVDASGKVHWLAAHGRSECDESGRPTRLLGVVRDVTERKNAEDALRQSEERFRRIADQSPDIIFRVGKNGLEYISNQEACEFIDCVEHFFHIGFGLNPCDFWCMRENRTTDGLVNSAIF
jgi:PAS domain-containing protein